VAIPVIGKARNQGLRELQAQRQPLHPLQRQPLHRLKDRGKNNG